MAHTVEFNLYFHDLKNFESKMITLSEGGHFDFDVMGADFLVSGGVLQLKIYKTVGHIFLGDKKIEMSQGIVLLNGDQLKFDDRYFVAIHKVGDKKVLYQLEEPPIQVKKNQLPSWKPQIPQITFQKNHQDAIVASYRRRIVAVFIDFSFANFFYFLLLRLGVLHSIFNELEKSREFSETIPKEQDITQVAGVVFVFVLYFFLRFLVTLFVGVSFGQWCVGIFSKGRWWRRCFGGGLRIILEVLLLPLWWSECIIFFKQRTLKEMLSMTRLLNHSQKLYTRTIFVVFFIPFSLFVLLSIENKFPIKVGLQKEHLLKDRKKSTNLTNWYDLKIRSQILEQNIFQIIPSFSSEEQRGLRRFKKEYYIRFFDSQSIVQMKKQSDLPEFSYIQKSMRGYFWSTLFYPDLVRSFYTLAKIQPDPMTPEEHQQWLEFLSDVKSSSLSLTSRIEKLGFKILLYPVYKRYRDHLEVKYPGFEKIELMPFFDQGLSGVIGFPNLKARTTDARMQVHVLLTKNYAENIELNFPSKQKDFTEILSLVSWIYKNSSYTNSQRAKTDQGKFEIFDYQLMFEDSTLEDSDRIIVEKYLKKYLLKLCLDLISEEQDPTIVSPLRSIIDDVLSSYKYVSQWLSETKKINSLLYQDVGLMKENLKEKNKQYFLDQLNNEE